VNREFRIDNDSWPGIFLTEEEAALALAGRGLPDRVLDGPGVSEHLRARAAASEELKRELLNTGVMIMHIARWTDGEMDHSVKVDVHQIRSYTVKNGSKIEGFRTFVSGRGYNMSDTSLLIDALQLAYRLASAARGYIENQRLAEASKLIIQPERM